MNVLTETFLSLAACFTSISECESLILKGHQVSKRRVELVCAQLVSGVLFPGDDHRKYKIRPNAVPESLKDNIRKHIVFSSQESHYSRSSNKKQKNLPVGLSIAWMY